MENIREALSDKDISLYERMHHFIEIFYKKKDKRMKQLVFQMRVFEGIMMILCGVYGVITKEFFLAILMISILIIIYLGAIGIKILFSCQERSRIKKLLEFKKEKLHPKIAIKLVNMDEKYFLWEEEKVKKKKRKEERRKQELDRGQGYKTAPFFLKIFFLSCYKKLFANYALQAGEIFFSSLLVL